MTKTLLRAVLPSVVLAIALVFVVTSEGRAHNHWVHVVRPGETLA
jgi:hypothetical protein